MIDQTEVQDFIILLIILTGDAECQSGILEGFSQIIPNSFFRNGGIKRNWSKIFIIFFVNNMKY